MELHDPAMSLSHVARLYVAGGPARSRKVKSTRASDRHVQKVSTVPLGPADSGGSRPRTTLPPRPRSNPPPNARSESSSSLRSRSFPRLLRPCRRELSMRCCRMTRRTTRRTRRNEVRSGRWAPRRN